MKSDQRLKKENEDTNQTEILYFICNARIEHHLDEARFHAFDWSGDVNPSTVRETLAVVLSATQSTGLC